MTASALHTLADRLGILSEYVDQTGRETRVTEDVTRVAIIAAMGFDASTEERAAAALTLLEVRDATRTLPPVRVLVHGSEFSIPTRGAVLTLERGGDWREGKELPIGYHTLTVGSENQTLIVVPPKCMAPIRPARDSVSAELRQRLSQLLTAEQKTIYDQMQRAPAPPAAKT